MADDPDGQVAVPVVLVYGAVAVAATVAVIHVVRMHTDAQYRQSFNEGAQRTGEVITAVVSSILSKRTEKNDAAETVAGEAGATIDRGGRGGPRTIQERSGFNGPAP